MVKRLADDESNCYHITHHKKPSTFCLKLYMTYEMGRDAIPNSLASLYVKKKVSVDVEAPYLSLRAAVLRKS